MRKILSAALALVCIWFASPAHAALPTGYTQLEYINMPAGAYLLTDIIPVYNGHYEIDFQTTEIQNSSAIFSGRTATYGGMLFTVASSGKFVVDAFGADSVDRYSSTVLPAANTRYKFIFNNKVATLESGDSRLFEHTFTGTGANGAVLVIKGTNSNGSIVGNNANYYIYSFQAWNPQGTLIANFVPAKNSSGVVGMYDTVNNRFYTNAGTGEFIAGDPVTTCDGTIVNYVSATGTVSQSGTPTPDNPIYPTFYQQGNMVLRKVGNIADSYDATTGKITRRVGVKVLDGTEDWIKTAGYTNLYETSLKNDDALSGDIMFALASTHLIGTSESNASMPDNSIKLTTRAVDRTDPLTFIKTSQGNNTLEGFKQYLAQQYANGTPVTVYYPLAEETTEDWTESQYCNANEPIKIATTKYNESAFGPLNTALANAISVVDTVVSNTITQAGRIATLQAQKQTRPNDIADDSEKCPAGKKCLLVEDASGVPHWYEIVEKYSRLPEGFTELQYVSNAANTYLDTGIIPTVDNVVMEMKVKPSTGSWYIWQNRDPSNSVIHGFSGANTGSKISFAFPNDSVATSTITRTGNILTMRSTMLNGQGKLYVHDDATNESDEQTIAYTFSAETLPYYLFGNQRSDTVNSGNVVYYAKMYMNDELVMDYIPAKRNRDGAIGFYDLASQSFKQANHGSFIAGPVAQ